MTRSLGKDAGLKAMDGNWIYLLIPMAAAFVVAVAATPLVRRAAWRLGVLAHPDAERRFHPSPVPLLGGVAVYAALIAGLAVALTLDRFRHPELVKLCWALIPTTALACVFGAVDDCWNLRWRAKLVLQFVAASTIAATCCSVDFLIVFGFRIELGYWGVPLTTLWLMGCINALNLIDGLDGLASVVGLSTATMMGLIALNMGNDHVAVASLALTAALAGFLLFNRPPASIFLGDSGSTLIGLMIGGLSAPFA
jgi:UDP-GlcNAc:undecaprenyl-phosphate GlcNAc-1-phosphate transferase